MSEYVYYWRINFKHIDHHFTEKGLFLYTENEVFQFLKSGKVICSDGDEIACAGDVDFIKLFPFNARFQKNKSVMLIFKFLKQDVMKEYCWKDEVSEKEDDNLEDD